MRAVDIPCHFHPHSQGQACLPTGSCELAVFDIQRPDQCYRCFLSVSVSRGLRLLVLLFFFIFYRLTASQTAGLFRSRQDCRTNTLS